MRTYLYTCLSTFYALVPFPGLPILCPWSFPPLLRPPLSPISLTQPDYLPAFAPLPRLPPPLPIRRLLWPSCPTCPSLRAPITTQRAGAPHACAIFTLKQPPALAMGPSHPPPPPPPTPPHPTRPRFTLAPAPPQSQNIWAIALGPLLCWVPLPASPLLSAHGGPPCASAPVSSPTMRFQHRTLPTHPPRPILHRPSIPNSSQPER